MKDRASESAADISVIIVNWNVRDLLDRCLASLLRATDSADKPTLEIIVVDCASSDDSASMLRRKYPEAHLMAQRENIGFSRGNNLALAAATADFLLLLNPDTEVSGDALGRMLTFLRQRPDVGIVGPHTLNSDGSHQSTRRRFPSLATGFFESTWLASLAPASLLDRYFMRDTADEAILEVDWVQGSALMLRREVYAAIGGLDPGFVMYSEELDYCKRAKAAGWKVVYHGGARIMHHGGKSSEQASAFKHIHFNQSKLRYFRKHHGERAYHLLRLNLLLQFTWQTALESGKWLLRHKRDLRRSRIDIYKQALRTRLKADL